MTTLNPPVLATINSRIRLIPDHEDASSSLPKDGQVVKIIGIEGMSVRLAGCSHKIWIDRVDLPELEKDSNNSQSLSLLHNARKENDKVFAPKVKPK
ncbi:MAG: hypothetical protein KW793_01445 [Candidatus Doudnabacteria bacterium]|nr:hypothetical protein [Candidatus Doudnabacteria bacterium]